MEFFWLGVVLLLSVIEMATADLITIWFIASGIVTLIISFFDIPFVAQVGIFVILGTVLLITTRKMLVEKLNKNKQKNYTYFTKNYNVSKQKIGVICAICGK